MVHLVGKGRKVEPFPEYVASICPNLPTAVGDIIGTYWATIVLTQFVVFVALAL
jgi:hypothetical protein